MTVEVSENPDSLFPPILRGQPSRGLWEEEHSGEQNYGWDNLNRPRDAKSSGPLIRVVRASPGEGGSVLDEVLDQDTPSDSPC